MYWSEAEVPEILNKSHQSSHSCSRGISCVDDGLSLSQLRLQVFEGFLIRSDKPSALNLIGSLRKSLGAYCQVLMIRVKTTIPHI